MFKIVKFENLLLLSILLLTAVLTACAQPTPQPLTLGSLPNRIIKAPAPSPANLPSGHDLDPYLPIIVLDPGHGGVDEGAKGNEGQMEKDITLPISLKLGDRLKKSLKTEVILTRHYDEFIPLNLRTSLVNFNQASLFISIHVNASPLPKPSGIETFFLSNLATDKEAERVAAFENSVIRFESGGKEKYEDLQSILIDIFQTEIQKESAFLAENVQINMAEELSARNRGVRQAPFFVLSGAACPAILVEVGFISNEKDLEKLMSDEYQEKIAAAIHEGIIKFRELLKLRMSG